MRVYQGEVTAGSEPSPPTAAAELAARIDEAVRLFETRVAVEPAAIEALRGDILELARAHAARTVLETITARDANRIAKRQRGPWGRRPQVQP